MTDKNDKPSNYFLMQRGWQNSDIFNAFDEPFDRRSAWIYLIENASWKPRKFIVGNRVFNLERGQLSCSLRYLAEAWGWNKDKVSTLLKTLQDLDMIQTDSQTGQNLITICNYNKYQIDVSETQTQARRKLDASQTEARRNPDKTKKVKTDNKVKKVKNIDIRYKDDELIKQAISEYGKLADEFNLPKPRIISEPLKAKTLKTLDDLEKLGSSWIEYMDIIRNSPHLLGKTKGNWKVKFGWIILYNNFVKIFNGDYVQQSPTQPRATPQQTNHSHRTIFDEIDDFANPKG